MQRPGLASDINQTDITSNVTYGGSSTNEEVIRQQPRHSRTTNANDFIFTLKHREHTIRRSIFWVIDELILAGLICDGRQTLTIITPIISRSITLIIIGQL